MSLQKTTGLTEASYHLLKNLSAFLPIHWDEQLSPLEDRTKQNPPNVHWHHQQNCFRGKTLIYIVTCATYDNLANVVTCQLTVFIPSIKKQISFSDTFTL